MTVGDACLLVVELDPAQPVSAQPVYPRAERGDGQELVVDGEPGRGLEAAPEARRHDGLGDRPPANPRQQAIVQRRRRAEACPVDGVPRQRQ